MRKITLTIATLLLATSSASFAQEAPAPRKAPRVPVQKQSVSERRGEVAPRDLSGQITVMDTERLKIGDVEFRLFGIVPPQLSASFGPQTRAVLDSATTKQASTCQIRDRSRDGRYLAVCRNAAGNDLALELLRRGLAVTARGSLTNTEFASAYILTEQAAQTQKVGLWSVITPVASVIPQPALETAKPVAEPKETAKEQAKEDRKEDRTERPEPPASKPEIKPETKAAATATPVVIAPVSPINADSGDSAVPPQASGILAQYQFLIAAILMLITAVGIFSALQIQKFREKRDEMKALAAALRGELMGARAICLGRIKAIQNEDDDQNATWPRLRSTLYQAYVGKLGWLGADMARQIASIYGQSGDYAAYYSDTNSNQTTPKKQALSTLVRHIESVLPRLADVETTGRTVTSGPDNKRLPPPQAPAKRLAQKHSSEKKQETKLIAPPVAVTEEVAPTNTAQTETKETVVTETTIITMAETLTRVQEPTGGIAQVTTSEDATEATPQTKITVAAPETTRVEEDKTTAPAAEKKPATVPLVVDEALAPAPTQATEDQEKSRSPLPLWKAMRDFAHDRFGEKNKDVSSIADDDLPDYSAMIEEESAGIYFSDDDFDDIPSPNNVTRIPNRNS